MASETQAARSPETRRPLRILKVCQSHYPYLNRGGFAFKVPELSRSLVSRGHAITVLTAYRGPFNGHGRLDTVQPFSWGWRGEYSGVEVVYLKSRLQYHNTTLNPGVFDFCRKRLREFDLVHIYGLYDLLGPVVASFCRRHGIPYIVEPTANPAK